MEKHDSPFALPLSRRHFLEASALLAGSLALSSPLRAAARESGGGGAFVATRPNVLLIYSDDQGFGDLGALGSEIPTPELDKLAAGGILFDNFYCPGPVCTPSRYGLLTGSYPVRSLNGLDSVIMPGDNKHFADPEVTLATRFRKAGYRTGLFGKWHLGHNNSAHYPQNQGFEHFSGHLGGAIDFFRHGYGGDGHDWYVNGVKQQEEGYATDLISNHAMAWLDSRKSDQKPFFAMLSYNAPHYGKSADNDIPPNTLKVTKAGTNWNTLQAPAEWLEKFSGVSDENRRYYSAMTANMDHNIGRVVARLEQNGQLVNTLIWFISDNGGDTRYGASNAPYSGRKHELHEGGIRIPAVFYWKGKTGAGRRNSLPLCSIDVTPTLAAFAGLDLAGGLPIDGVDASRAMLEGQALERDLYWAYLGLKAFRRGNHKLRDGKLFDLAQDPGESKDLRASQSLVYAAMDTARRHLEDCISGFPATGEACNQTSEVLPLPLLALDRVGSFRCYAVQEAKAGASIYSDRDYTLTGTALPTELTECLQIITANDDKLNCTQRVLDLHLQEECHIYLAVDARGEADCPWMKGFTDTGKRLKSSSGFEMKLLLATVSAGELRLGGNRDRGNQGAINNYVVFIKKTGTPAVKNLGWAPGSVTPEYMWEESHLYVRVRGLPTGRWQALLIGPKGERLTPPAQASSDSSGRYAFRLPHDAVGRRAFLVLRSSRGQGFSVPLRHP